MPAPYNGKCLCGGVQLTITSEPVKVLSCFCEHCSKGAGGLGQVIGKFPSESVQVTKTAEDQISIYMLDETSSGNPKEKAFCKTCGAPLWTVPGAAKGKFFMIRTSQLDGGLEQLKPNVEIFAKCRPSWAEAVDGVPQAAEMPAETK